MRRPTTREQRQFAAEVIDLHPTQDQTLHLRGLRILTRKAQRPCQTSPTSLPGGMRFLLSLLLLGICHAAWAVPPSLIILDAGHGGKDSGGTGNGLVEKNLTLDTALRVAGKLQHAGVKTLLLRHDDHFIELDDRVALANRYRGKHAVLVSIHYNAVRGSEAHGTETFFWRPDATALAIRIQQQVSRHAGTADLGINRRRLHLTRNPEIPAVLVECGYMTNRREASRIAQSKVRDAIASGIAGGILEFCQKGERGIRRVPEIASPLSRKSDPRSGGQHIPTDALLN